MAIDPDELRTFDVLSQTRIPRPIRVLLRARITSAKTTAALMIEPDRSAVIT